MSSQIEWVGEMIDRDLANCRMLRKAHDALLDSAVTPLSPTEFRWRIGPHEGLAGSREDARRAVERWGTRHVPERPGTDRLKESLPNAE
jgi:hypothetical protein